MHSNLRTDFLLKVDPDVSILYPKVYNLLPQLVKKKRVYGHIYDKKSRPTRGKDTELHYRGRFMPTFAAGSAYLLTGDIISFIAENAGRFHNFANEDSALGLWIAPLGVQFEFMPFLIQCTEGEPLASRPVDSNDLFLAWDNFEKSGSLCHPKAIPLTKFLE